MISSEAACVERSEERSAVRRGDAGLSIIEVVIGMVIFLITMQGLLLMGTLTLVSNRQNAKITRATAIGQQQMEAVKSAGFSNVQGYAGTENYNTISGYAEFKRVTAVTADAGDTNVRHVSVTVYWMKDRKNVSLESDVSR